MTGFAENVVSAICTYMNVYQRDNVRLIVENLTPHSAVQDCTMTNLDSDAAEFTFAVSGAESSVRIPWSRSISERHEIKEELFELLDRAMAPKS